MNIRSKLSLFLYVSLLGLTTSVYPAFGEGTQVFTWNRNTCSIQHLKVGGTVCSYDVQNKCFIEVPIKKIEKKTINSYVTILTDADTHPLIVDWKQTFYGTFVFPRGHVEWTWIRADILHPNTPLYRSYLEYGPRAAEIKTMAEPITVYDIYLDSPHSTFFVSPRGYDPIPILVQSAGNHSSALNHSTEIEAYDGAKYECSIL